MLAAMADSSTIFWCSDQPDADLGVALSSLGVRLEEIPNQEWDPRTATIGGVRDIELSTLSLRPRSWSALTLHLRSGLAEALASRLVEVTMKPAIAFFEFNQAAWGLSSYMPTGRSLHFVNRPGLLEVEPDTISAVELASAFSVRAEDITGYLQHLGPEDMGQRKIRPEDESNIGDHWVRVDLMRTMGLPYPNPGAGTCHLLIKERGVNC